MFMHPNISSCVLHRTYLVREDTRQIVNRSDGDRRLVLSSQAFHEVCNSHNALLLGWRLAHECGGIWRETVHIHLGEVNRCVLTGAGEDDGSKKVIKLDAACEGRRDAVVCMAWCVGVSVVMQVANPVLQFVILTRQRTHRLSHLQRET